MLPLVLIAGVSIYPASLSFARPPAPEAMPCGKAQSMIAGKCLDDAPPSPFTAGTRELMGETDVLHYALDIEVTNLNPSANNCTVTGTNVITVRSKSPSLTQFTIRLHSNYTITSAAVTDGGNSIAVSTSQTSTTTRVVTLNRAYGMDEQFLLTIAYTGTSISMDDSIDVGTQGGTTVVATLSDPFGAYTWWPCKDGDVATTGDNSDKATFEMNVTVPNNFVVPSNGLLQGVDVLSGNRNRYRWATNYPMTTYLASFAATNYNTWTQTYNFPAGPYNPAGSMPVQFFIYPVYDNSSNRASWEKCLNMLTVYRTIYGEYPFVNEKYGIYNFNYGGGMEHQTMTGQGTFDEGVTAHELSHQWWGDMITNMHWGDVWLNEGFATYSECLWAERKAGGIDTAAYLSAINGRRPIGNGANGSVYRYNVSSFNAIFNSTYAYNKGAWVCHMLRHAVGDQAYFDTLAAYRNEFAFGSVATEDFAAVASTVSGRDLTAFFNQWVYQKGAPTYQYGWQSVNVGGQNYLLARIAQTQTATTGSPPQVLDVYQMPVDLNLTIGGNSQTVVVQDTARTQWFVVRVSGPVSALAFDTEPYILRGSTTSVAYIPGPPKIVATGPSPGALILQPNSPSQLSVTFHTAINAADANFSLVGAATGAHPMTLVSGSNVNPAILNLPAVLPPDTYTLTVTSGVTAVDSGMALDGEIANPFSPASLPSGDGLAGGDAVIKFTVQACAAAADIDQNCVRDGVDADIFVQVLLGLDTDAGHVARSDVDGSGAANGDDVGPFAAAFLAP